MHSIETTRETLKESSIELLKLTGWKPGDKFSFHSVSELMVALAVKVVKGEIGCGYPDCGCCADAACEDAIKQHPDLGGTPPQKNGHPSRAEIIEALIDGAVDWKSSDHGQREEHQADRLLSLLTRAPAGANDLTHEVSTSRRYNVAADDENGHSSIMCVDWMAREDAEKVAAYYRETYVGKPFPNGKGHYSVNNVRLITEDVVAAANPSPETRAAAWRFRWVYPKDGPTNWTETHDERLAKQKAAEGWEVRPLFDHPADGARP
ncbi:Hypothetical protein NGAL_HAMBI1146_59920 [Neorhizobium galegae bv. officinalis]|nr:Hypothetical protein NGAL_HAMBI1146_59920 [Neorhizobium galegae bv. officinalis]